jgi:hypothetical protein
MRRSDANQVALLPLMKKPDADDHERNQEKQTNDSADDELNESPLVFFSVPLQWAEPKGQLLEVNLGALKRRLGGGVDASRLQLRGSRANHSKVPLLLPS